MANSLLWGAVLLCIPETVSLWFERKLFAQKGSMNAFMFLLYADTCSLYIQGQRCQYSSRAESNLLLWLQKEADVCPETGLHCALLS